jgi:uncharacterized protein (DUF427 family)
MSVQLLRETTEIIAARTNWQHTGIRRPDFAEAAGPGERSVWDFPRPPLIEQCQQVLEVRHGDKLIARTSRGVSVLETASAPTYYFPPNDIVCELTGDGGSSICEWKGLAEQLSTGGLNDIGWRYIAMFPAFVSLHLWVSFYPAHVDCYVGEERVKPQPGGFYGGWVTRDLVGPIKGLPGSSAW